VFVLFLVEVGEDGIVDGEGGGGAGDWEAALGEELGLAEGLEPVGGLVCLTLSR